MKKTPRILLLGANGQVGWELRRALLPLGEVRPMNRREADLADLEGLRRLLEREKPDVIVNAAAYTAVDKAESEPEAAYRINAEAPGVLAGYAAACGAWLVHYSTDYVFDGRKDGPYAEGDRPNPQSVYGRSKLAGEEAVAGSGCRHLILRTSWVYAVRGHNFAKTMLRLAAERESLKVVADQIGAPTSAELIADVSAIVLRHLLLQPELGEGVGGVYHLTASGCVSWHEYARFVIAAGQARGLVFRCTPDAVLAITTAEYPLPAARPANSRLDCRKLEETFAVVLPPWQKQVERMIEEISV